MSANMQVIIPMSGIGKRFVDAKYADPKPLIKVDGIPIIHHVIDLFPGETNFTFICNNDHLQNTNMKDVILSKVPNAKIYEVDVNDRQGPVHAVSKIFDHIDEKAPVLLSYCDYGTWWNYEEFKNQINNTNVDGAIACYKGFHPHMLGSDNYAFVREHNMSMLEIQEKKPFTDNKMNEYASNGTYYFKNGAIVKKYFQELMDLNIHIKNEFYISMVYNLLVRDNLHVLIFEIDNMLQWGTPYDLEIYNMWSGYFSNIINDNKQFIHNNGTLLLPMAGKGSRFSAVGYDVPKPMLDVNGYPMFIQAIRCLPQENKYIFVCLQEHIDDYNLLEVIKTEYPNSNVIGITDVTEGQACTCEIGIKFSIDNNTIDLEKPIIITACDNGVYYNTQDYEKLINDQNVDVIVWSFSNNPTSKNNPQMYAWLDVDSDGFIHDVSVKKPFYNKKNEYAIIGTMYFRKASYYMDGLKKIYEKNIRTNEEFYVDNMLKPMIDAGYKVKNFNVSNYICWGTPDDYKTYLYWRDFFDKCWWHPYKKSLDVTYKI